MAARRYEISLRVLFHIDQTRQRLKKREFISKLTFSLPLPSSMLKLPIFWVERSDNRKYVCVRRLFSFLTGGNWRCSIKSPLSGDIFSNSKDDKAVRNVLILPIISLPLMMAGMAWPWIGVGFSYWFLYQKSEVRPLTPISFLNLIFHSLKNWKTWHHAKVILKRFWMLALKDIDYSTKLKVEISYLLTEEKV